MSLSRKRKKEIRKLQDQAASYGSPSRCWWATQRSSHVRRAASSATTAASSSCPQAQAAYGGMPPRTSTRACTVASNVLHDTVMPAASAVVGSALSVMDAAADTRAKLNAGRGLAYVHAAPVLVPSEEERDRSRRSHRDHLRCRRGARGPLRGVADAPSRRRALGRRRPAART